MQTYHNLSTDKIQIVAPIGGFGNHVRNLLMLDNKFAFKVTPTKERYAIFAGPDWPTYDEYCTHGLNASMTESIRYEIQNLCKEFTNLLVITAITSEQKADFIINYVYHHNRTWHNWMHYEHPFRYGTSDIIEYSHTCPSSFDLPTVCLTCDSEIAFAAYFKFNSNLNGTPKEHFLNTIKEYNQTCADITDSNVIIMSTDSLKAPVLDPVFYNMLIQQLGFDNNYNLANQLHQTWYNLHKKSESEFVSFVNNLYGPA